MNNTSVKEKIDVELKTLCFSEDMKQNVKNSKKRGIGIPHRITRYAAAIAAIVMLGSTTVLAGYMLLNRVNVNDTTLPELDNMTVINYTPPEHIFLGFNSKSLRFFPLAVQSPPHYKNIQL